MPITRTTNRMLKNNLQIYAKEIGLIGNGSTNDATKLNTWITSIGSTKVDLVITSGTYLISTNVVFPANIRIVGMVGGMFKVSSGISITGTNTLLECGLWQVFDLSLGGTVVGSWNIGEVYPEWFGAKGDDATKDTLGVKQSLQFIDSTNVEILSLYQGRTYVINDTLFPPSNLTISGNNATLKVADNSIKNPHIFYIYLDKENILIKNTRFDGNRSNLTGFYNMISVYQNCDNIVFDSCYFANTRGLSLIFSTNIRRSGARNCIFYDCGTLYLDTGVLTDRKPTLSFCCGSAENNYSNFSVGNTFEKIGLDSISASEQTALNIEGNYIKNDGSGAIAPINCIDTRIVNNYVTEAGGNAIDVNNCKRTTIIGNILYKNDAAGIMIASGIGTLYDCVVSDNICTNNYQSYNDASPSAHKGGITIDAFVGACDNIIITNNISSDDQTTKTQEYGIYLRGSNILDNVIIDNNICKNNTVSNIDINLYKYIKKSWQTPLTNMIANGSFEDGAQLPWDGVGSVVTVDNTDFKYGVNCGKSTHTSGGDSRLFRQVIPILPLNKYYMRVWAKVPSGQSYTKLKLMSNIRDSGNGVLQDMKIDESVSINTWEPLSGITLAPIGASTLNFQIQSTISPISGDIAKIDNAMLINLTDMFGIGNEPTATFMDNIIDAHFGGWFDFANNFSQSKEVKGSVSYDPPSLADGEGVTTTMTVKRVSLGDFAIASFSNAQASVIINAWVSATDTVSVRFQNESGGVVDLASGTLRVKVIKV